MLHALFGFLVDLLSDAVRHHPISKVYSRINRFWEPATQMPEQLMGEFNSMKK